MKNYCIQTNRERKSARYDYILHQNCKTNCKTQKIVSADCSVFNVFHCSLISFFCFKYTKKDGQGLTPARIFFDVLPDWRYATRVCRLDARAGRFLARAW